MEENGRCKEWGEGRRANGKGIDGETKSKHLKKVREKVEKRKAQEEEMQNKKSRKQMEREKI